VVVGLLPRGKPASLQATFGIPDAQPTVDE